MLMLILFALLFVGGHFLLSMVRLRAALVARLGEKGFLGLFSLFSLLGLGGLIWAYAAAPYVGLWGEALRWLPLVVMPVAFVLLVCGMASRNPSAIGQSATGDGPRGIFRITRHPAMWGFGLWALAHIPPNGDLASLILFGALAFLALGGAVHQDHRKRAVPDAAWQAYEQQTSHLPFRAIAEDRTELVLAEIGWKKPAVGLVLYAALLHFHRMIFGVSPLP